MELTLACMVSVAIVHCILFTLNIQSAQYLRLSCIIVYRTSFCVVAFSVSAAFVKLIPHSFLKSYGFVFECSSADNKYRCFLTLVGFFGGSGTVSI